MSNIYHITHPDRILSPSLVVFRDLVAANIDRMIEIAGGTARLRPHCKTHKMPAVVAMQLERGITKQKAATIAEAEMLAQVGVPDVFLGYNLVGPNVARMVELVQTYPNTKFAATTDDVEMIVSIGRAMTKAGLSLDLLLDIDPGRHRTGVEVGDIATELYRVINETHGVQPGGLHVYDGHQGQLDFNTRAASVTHEWERIATFRNALVKEGLEVPRIVCGGTPTFPVYARMDDPTIEFSPGTIIFQDASYGDKFPDLTGFTPAAMVFTRVISRPTDNRITFDCGTKAVASDPPMGQRVVLPALPDAVQVLQNEEHLVVETDSANLWKPGDWTLAIPRHVCPTSALHAAATVITDGEIVDEWPTIARDRKLTI